MAFITRYPIDVDRAKASDSIDVQAKTVGALAAGAFPELDTFDSTIFTAGGAKWLKATAVGTTAAPWTAKTKHDAFDQEVTTFCRLGLIALRYANGKGLAMIFAQHAANPNGSITIGTISVDDTQPVPPALGGFPFQDQIWSDSNLTANYGFVGANYATDTITFGVSGFDLYVKYNGVALDIPELEGAAFRIMEPGKILFSAAQTLADPEGTAGFRDIAISYPAKPSTRHSNMTGKVIDMRDYGVKHLETTGSISAASNQLTVASAAGFAVGDQVIVAVGGETALSSIYSNTAAAGRRGTIGVGGSWPPAARLYATEAERLAATPAEESYGALDTGKVYLRGSSSWNAWESGYYYWNMIVPYALVAKITAIAGNVLTLDTNAVASTANAQVCFDCLPCYKPLSDQVSAAFVSPAVLLPQTPAGGAFYQSGLIDSVYRNGLKLRGHSRNTTKLQTPKGANPQCFNSTQANDVVISDMWYVGNHDLHGYGTLGRGAFGYGFNISGQNAVYATGCRMERLRTSEVASQAYRTTTTEDCVIDDCHHELLVSPQQCYLQWNFNAANATRPVISNCVSDGNWLTPSFEVFACQDGVIRNCGGRNNLFSSNSCDGTFYDEIYTTIEANCRATNVASPTGEASILQFNANVGSSSGGANGIPGQGGRIRNPRIVIEGYMDANNWHSCPINITSAPNVLIEGTYDPLVADDGQRKGYLAGPRRIESGTSAFANSATKINADGSNVTVRGIRVDYVDAIPNGTGVAVTPPDYAAGINLYYAPTATISNIAALGTGTGSVTLSSLAFWDSSGVLQIGSELMEYTVTNSGTRTVSITSRGFGGTTAVSHSNGVTATGVDYSVVEDCIVDVISIKPTASQSGNITNAAYAAL